MFVIDRTLMSLIMNGNQNNNMHKVYKALNNGWIILEQSSSVFTSDAFLMVNPG